MALQENLRRLRKAAGLTQAALAEKAGVPQSIISEIESGKRKSTGALPEIAQAIGRPLGELDPRFGMGESSYTPPPDFIGERDLPVYAAVEGGAGEMVVSTDAIEMVPRPWFMKGKEGYAVLVVGDSMEPEFEPGDMAIVNPRLPVLRGKAAIFISQEHEGDFRASIKRLVRSTESHWIVRQFNPAREMKLARSQWGKALRVVGKYAGG